MSKSMGQLIQHKPDWYDFTQYGLCSEQSARFCILDEFKGPNLNFLFANIHRWLVSKRRADMITGERYYKNENDILDRKRYFYGRQGQQIENKNVSNSKLNHPLFRKIVTQKIGYLLRQVTWYKNGCWSRKERTTKTSGWN